MDEELAQKICDKLDELITLMEQGGYETMTKSGEGFVGIANPSKAHLFIRAWQEVEDVIFPHKDQHYLPPELPPPSLVDKTLRTDGAMEYTLGDDAAWWINFVSPEEAATELGRLRRQIATALTLYWDAEARSRLITTLEGELKEGFK